jgi:uncharacterized protein (DUF4415 family)
MSRLPNPNPSKQVAVRIPHDVLLWLCERAGPCRGIATVVNEILRTAFNTDLNPQKRSKRK